MLLHRLSILFLLINVSLACILSIEYWSFKDQMTTLLDLQERYQSYLLVVRGTTPELTAQKETFVTIDRSQRNLDALFGGVSKAAVLSHTTVRSRAKQRRGLFSWPVEKRAFWISSFFGPRKLGRQMRFHYGIDLAALTGTPVVAAAGGRVVEADFRPGYGNTVVIVHNRKYKTRYAHLDAILVRPGMVVKRRQKVGTVGATGFVRSEGSDASHLHFEVYAFDKQVNPILLLEK